MIRAYHPSDLDALLALWLPSTIAAHPFVAETYWHESKALVRDQYIPQSCTWLYLQGEDPVGFISVLEQRFIGALFVAEPYHGQGVAQALMQQAQRHYSPLSLEVYQRNARACAFYHQQGFQVMEKYFNQETQATILIMSWSAPTLVPNER